MTLHDEVRAHNEPDSVLLDTREAMEQKEIPEGLPLDAAWDEMHSTNTLSGTDYRYEELTVYKVENYPDTSGLPDVSGGALTPFSDTDKAITTPIS